MKTQRTTLLLTLLAPLPALGIGYVYTGVGGGGRQLLELTSVTVDVQIDERVARTRTDQVFTNRADRVVEGIYEFTLPEGAIITDLVLWIGDKRVQGIIMEKEAARRVYDAIVRRRIDPALIEQVTANQFRLSIFPFPAQGSRRVEFEYMQLLEARSGRIDYTFPLAPETDQPLEMKLFVLRAQVRSQHPFEASVSGLPRLTAVTRPDEHSAEIFFGDEEVSPREDFTLTLRPHDDQRKPTVLSFAPQGAEDLGYYALWLPPVPELTQGDPLPRSLTFVIDISSSMQRGKLQAVKGALAAALAALEEADLFNLVVFTHRADAFAAAPVPADPSNKEAALAFLNRQDALAEEHQGEAYFLSEEGDIEAALRELFAAFTFPLLRLDELSFDPVEIHDVHPRGVESLAAGRELFQVGRYRGGGAFTLRVSGHLGEERVVLDYPLEFTQTEVSAALIPRLWAYQKVQALEAQIARFGAQQELLDDILALGLDYRLVTRRTSLFAPDEGVEINPEPREGSVTAVHDERQTARWLGRDFVLQDDVWIDLAYQPGMPKESYTGAPGQPAELAAFAALGQAMLVVIEGRAYEVRPRARPSRPVLLQNVPNPFNASTVISFHVPVALAGEEARLTIYNLTGQRVRLLAADTRQAGEHRLTWDACDKQGRAVATGVYVYRLEMGEEAVYRRMLLVR